MAHNDDDKTAKLFLSYERKDKKAVERLYHMLKGAGYEPWIDTVDILGGEYWKDAIKRAIRNCDFFLACLSENSVDKRGEIQREIKTALSMLEEKCEGDIFLIPVRLQPVEIPERLRDIQWVDLFEKDGWQRLKKSIESQGFPGINKPATPAPKRWSTCRDIRQPILDVVTPTYILDNTFHFLDWNTAFDELVAKPMKIRRGEHGLEFIRQLANCRDVIERSKEVFGAGQDPLVDIELLHFDSDKYGIILFQKLAAQIADDQGNPMAWCVNLNVLVAEHLQEVWDDLRKRLEQDVNWSRYAVSYDKLLMPFDDYRELVDQIVELCGNARRCADLGAGTGNGTVRLLETNLEREVWAVESNESMLEYLRAKVNNLETGSNVMGSWTGNAPPAPASYLSRLTIVKEDILRMDDLPREYFDAVMLINVLYTIEDPRACLEQAHRLLRPGGVLVLSTPHSDTDVDKLFARMREVLERKQLFEKFRLNYENARKAHEKLNPLIHRLTKQEIRDLLQGAGFEIADPEKDWRDDAYVGAVVVVRARKKGGSV